MGAVLFGFLGHQADVGDVAHGGRIEGPVFDAVLDDRLVGRGVAAVGDHGHGLVELAVRAPHLPRFPDDDRHGGVDDDVAGHVQVGDALVGIDHGQGRPLGVDGLDVVLDLFARGFRQGLDLGVEVAQAVVDVDPELFEHGGMLVQGLLVEDGDRVAEEDRVRDLHHRGLQVQGQEQALGLGVLDLLLVELAQGLLAHESPGEDFAWQRVQLVFQDFDRPVLADELDLEVGALAHGHGFFVAVEIAAAHVDDPGLGIGLPGAQLMGVLLGEVLDRKRGPPVGVAFAEDGVDGAAQGLGVAGLDLPFLVVLGILGIVGQRIALRLELLDGFLELGDRGADVGQLDDVGLGRQGQLTELSQIVGDFLPFFEIIGEIGDDAAGQGNVPGFHLDARSLGEFLDDGKQGVRGQIRSLVRVRPDDLMRAHESSSG